MTNLSIFVLLSAVFVVIGIIAFSVRHETISTRHWVTQAIVICAIVGGLFGIKGHYELGLTLSIVSTICYIIRWRRFRQDKRYCEVNGIPLPECKKP